MHHKPGDESALLTEEEADELGDAAVAAEDRVAERAEAKRAGTDPMVAHAAARYSAISTALESKLDLLVRTVQQFAELNVRLMQDLERRGSGPVLLDAEQAAELMAVKPSTIRRLIAERQIEVVSMGGRTYRVTPAALAAYVRKHAEPPTWAAPVTKSNGRRRG